MQIDKALIILLVLLSGVVLCINPGIVVGIPLPYNLPNQNIPLPYSLENFTIQSAEFTNV
jgi:hypothetical protein